MTEMITLLRAARRAAEVLAQADTVQKNTALSAMAAALLHEQSNILAGNALDMQAAQERGISAAMQDRLLLTPSRIVAMADALKQIAQLPDPIHQERPFSTRPNGVQVNKHRIPLGVIAMIYEARPNVTAEAGALCLKAGNACVLRGGSEAFHSNQAIAKVLHAALRVSGLPDRAITIMPTTDRAALLELLQQDELVDLVIPRGGEGLIRFVAQNSRIPVIKHYKGICHLYVDRDADLSQALALLIDGKCTRPAVCNALETLLVHAEIAPLFMPAVHKALADHQVEIRGCARTLAYCVNAKAATDEDYAAEFLDRIISVKILDTFTEAVAHIARFGSHHSEVIATQNADTAEKFIRAVDASAVMVNASSRFNDGGELGLGAEIGIATSKLHAYGAMGLESLTCEKFVLRGNGQVRHPPTLN